VIAELLTLAALTWQDPSGDAHGAGDLAPPTAEVYSSLAPFDLVEASVLDDALLVVEVRLAGIPDPGRLPNGLTLPVLDVYLDTGEGGREELLPGPEMAMPAGRGWELALRVHGDDAFLVDAGEPDGRPRPLAVSRRGDVLRLETGLPRPEEIRDLHALTGVYDPFRNDAWRPLAATPSPWAFASETPAPPVVDLLADDDAAQRDALRAFTLPARRTRSGSVPWLVLMLTGLGVAIVGLGLRRRVPVEGAGADASAATTTADEGGGGDAADVPTDRDATDATDATDAPGATVPEPADGNAAGATAPPVGRAWRGSPRAARRDADDAADGDGARVLRTTWAGRDGWWVEEPDADDAPGETLWDATAETGPDVEDATATATADGTPSEDDGNGEVRDEGERWDDEIPGADVDVEDAVERADEPESVDERSDAPEDVDDDTDRTEGGADDEERPRDRTG
jgi:hypothetical protein